MNKIFVHVLKKRRGKRRDPCVVVKHTTFKKAQRWQNAALQNKYDLNKYNCMMLLLASVQRFVFCLKNQSVWKKIRYTNVNDHLQKYIQHTECKQCVYTGILQNCNVHVTPNELCKFKKNESKKTTTHNTTTA